MISRSSTLRAVARGVVLASLALGVSACERGCLMHWFEDRSASPGLGATRDGAPSVDLGGTDCSDGLARCVDGRVETSVAGHVPYPCTAPRERPGSCECAWSSATTCEAGCVKDGLEVVASAEIARVQLCAPPAGAPALRPPTPAELGDVSICADEAVSCIQGVVRACTARGQPARVLGACAHGCAVGIAAEPGDLATSDGAAAILCLRAHAERR